MENKKKKIKQQKTTSLKETANDQAKKTIIILAVILILTVVVLTASIFKNKNSGGAADKDNSQFPISNFQSNSKSQILDSKQIQNFPKQNELAAGQAKLEIQNSQIYTNQQYGFSLVYPAEMKMAEFKEAGGDIVLAQSQISNNAGFQIFIIPFDEEGPITPERIKQDLPEMGINEPQNAIIGEGGIKALIFFGEESGLGRTREVWFIHEGFLYQVFAPAEMDAFLAKIMDTWKFQNF